MNLKVSKETESGLNIEFVNMASGRHIPLQQAINQIQKRNPNYKHYETVDLPNGTTYVRSKADKSKRNNIER